MENEYYYFMKYLKYKKKFYNLKAGSKMLSAEINNQEDKNWGFGVEQEFPILIKLSEKDKYNLNALGFNDEFIELNDIHQELGLNLKPSFKFAFLNYEKILDLKEKIQDTSFLKKNIDFDLMEEHFLEINQEINDYITNFISLPDKTRFSTFAILIKIKDKYQSIQNKFIKKFKIEKILESEYDNLSIDDIIYDEEDSLIKIYEKDKNIFIVSKFNHDHLLFEKDIGGYEIRSDNFRNTTVKAVVTELIGKKLSIKEYLIDQYQIEDDNIIFIDQETMYYDKEYKYSGEAEINITLPYMIPVDVDKFKEQHINLMKSLQYLSPLFLASFTGSYPNSFGDNKAYYETSYRYNQGSRILVTDVNNIYNLGLGDEHYGITHETIKKIYQNHKFEIKFKNNFIGEIEFSVNRNSNKFVPTKNKFFGFEWKIIDQYPIKYVSNITLFVVMLAQHLQEYNVNIPEDPRDSFNVLNNSEWPYKLLEEIIYEGWNVYMGNHIEYIQLLKDRLSLDRYYIDLDDIKTAFDLLNSLHNSFFNYYKLEGSNTDIIDCFFPNFKESDKYYELYDLPNINRRSYNNMVDMMKKNNIENFNFLKNNIIKNPYNEDYDDYNYYLTQQNTDRFV